MSAQRAALSPSLSVVIAVWGSDPPRGGRAVDWATYFFRYSAYLACFGFLPFLRLRFRHGRQFGRMRVRGRGLAIRVLGVCASPLIPAVLLARIAMRVARSGRDWGAFAVSLPLLGCFAVAWALGAASGYLAPREARPRS